MSFKEVSTRKFDALMAKRLELKKCSRCQNFGAEIIIPMVAYGLKVHHVFVRCKYCGYETKSFDASTHLRDAETGRIGNFVLNPSMASAIHSAVNDWNRRAEDGKAR